MPRQLSLRLPEYRIDTEVNLSRHQGIAIRTIVVKVFTAAHAKRFDHDASPETRRFTGPNQ